MLKVGVLNSAILKLSCLDSKGFLTIGKARVPALKLPMDNREEQEWPFKSAPEEEALDSKLESDELLIRLSLKLGSTGYSFKKRDRVLISEISGLLDGSFSSIIDKRTLRSSETLRPLTGKFN
jgi:hypothetical protein